MAILSIAFQSKAMLRCSLARMQSIPFDFWIKSTGKGDFQPELTHQLPFVSDERTCYPLILRRSLALNCLTTHYADLWTECWDDAFRDEQWLGDDPRLDPDFWRNLTP